MTDRAALFRKVIALNMTLIYLISVCDGNRNQDTNARIVNGEKSNQLPFIVSLQKATSDKNSSFKHFCTASIITPEHILTTASCFLDSDVKSSKLRGIFGTVDVNNDTLNFSFDQKSVKFHPDFIKRGVDIAIIALPKPLDLALPLSKAITLGCKAALTNLVAGWGRINCSHYSEELLYAQGLLVDTEKCRDDWIKSGYRPPVLSSDKFCAKLYSVGDKKEASVDFGDGGAPIFANISGNYTQFGLTSFRAPGKCANGAIPQVFTRLSYAHAFIRQVTKSKVKLACSLSSRQDVSALLHLYLLTSWTRRSCF